MSKWVQVASREQIEEGKKKCLNAETTPVVVCNIGGEWQAFTNMCPHAGLPLGEGDLSGTVITCPFHGYAFDVVSGKNVDFADDVPLRKLPVRVTDDGKVEVDTEG